MNRSLNLIARAKINLSLAVTGKRDDGYHTISSIMQQISLRDTLRIRITDGEGVSLQSNVPYLPTDSRNLCVKAALLYLEYGKLQKKINIHVNKRIPVAAGLAGGSTDAAAVLLGLESVFHVFGCDLPALALRLGADVPFCLTGGVCLCEGIGEILTPLESNTSGCPVVIAKNVKGLSTPYIYQLYDGLETPPSMGDTEKIKTALSSGNIRNLADSMFNHLEAVSLKEKPEIAALKARLLALGATGAMMSGSGPSVFGLFQKEEDAKKAAAHLRKQGMAAYFATFM
ncbi:MAG TPA: 4-(cytidine 5'-diphospho)-2-C-methyl-D-erythritol kinase [Clostridiales bacterium]|nr:4-(cytidine 5'-diphospho)-2-C-methyl-D-erythritol kinase [Clostridiales bacterium]